jgi:GntR family transcriptional regulator
MFNIDLQSRTPVWEQIVNQVQEFILAGLLKPEDKLPSIRELSVQAGINPNTIAKAYAELNRLGIVVSAGGRGCFIDRNVYESLHSKAEKRLDTLAELARDLYLSGIAEEVLIDTVKKGIRSKS